MVHLFDVPTYFILLRETLEITIILAVLLGFIDKFVPEEDPKLKKSLKKDIWIGTGAGLAIAFIIGSIFVAIFYTLARNLWEKNEDAWEGSFSLVASVVITIMALSMIRVNQWKMKWEGKLQSVTENYLERHKEGNKWALISLPFIVVLREAVESFVFIAGVGFDKSPTGIPIPVVLGILSGLLIGWLIYKGSHVVSLKIFFGATTVLLLFIAAGLFSISIDKLQVVTGSNRHVLWKLNCCAPEDNFWEIMKDLFGWTNEATVGTTAGYFSYWAAVIIIVLIISYMGARKDKRESEKVTDNEATIDNETITEKQDMV